MAGDLSARAATNTTIAASLVKQLAPLLLNFVLLVLYAVVMVAYSPLLAAIGIASVVINLGMARLISGEARECDASADARCGQSWPPPRFPASKWWRPSRPPARRAAISSVGPASRQVSTRNRSASRAWGQRLGLVPQLVMQVTNTAVLMTGVYLVLQGQFTVGMILAFQGYLSQFMAPASTLASVIADAAGDAHRHGAHRGRHALSG